MIWKEGADLSTLLAPDFLLILVALANFMGLSLLKAAPRDRLPGCVARNSDTLRSHGTPEQAR
jgi:hypothetical protein